MTQNVPLDVEEDLDEAMRDDDVADGPSALTKAKRTVFILGGVSLVAFIVFWQVVASVSAAKNQNSSTVAGQKGSGDVVVSARSVSEASVDSTVSVPDNSPLASQARARENAELKAATESGESYIPRVRVQPKEAPPSENSEDGAPSPTKVDERGQEVGNKPKDESASKKESARAAEAENRSKGALVGTPPQGEEDRASPSERELAANVRQEDMRRKLADLERQRIKAEQELLQENAKALFSGSPHVPPAKSWFKAPPSDPGYYQSGTAVVAMQITEMERGGVASALYRRDGATTRFGEGHPGVGAAGTPGAGASRTQPPAAAGGQELAKRSAGSAINSGGAAEQGQASLNRDALTKAKDGDGKVIKMGELIYAHLTLPMNSDVPGPIRIKIDQGKLKGGIALGNFQILNYGVGAGLRINVISHEGKVYRANAWAVSPDTELYAFDQDVDNHYFSRFAGLAAGGFLTGYLTSLVDATTTTDDGDTSTTTSRIEGSKDRVIYSMGKAAEAFMPIFYDLASRPVTVRVPKGQEMALLFLDDVVDPARLPQQQVTEQSQPEGAEPASTTSGQTANVRPIDPALALSDVAAVTGLVAGKAVK